VGADQQQGVPVRAVNHGTHEKPRKKTKKNGPRRTTLAASRPAWKRNASHGCTRTNKDLIMPFPVDIRFVNETEQKLGVKFPPSFVNYMVKQNGGEVVTEPDSWQLFPFFDTSDRKRLARTCNDIVRETSSARNSAFGFPPEAVAVGANGTGDHLVFLPQADAPHLLDHAVWWWDHETGELNRVADDFSDLVSE
jgi:hypothetical protein